MKPNSLNGYMKEQNANGEIHSCKFQQPIFTYDSNKANVLPIGVTGGSTVEKGGKVVCLPVVEGGGGGTVVDAVAAVA